MLVAGAILAALLAWYWASVSHRAGAAAAYAARVSCSCRYVAGRALDDCERDFLPGMGAVMLTEDTAAKSVTATVPLLARQTAVWHRADGCMLESWED